LQPTLSPLPQQLALLVLLLALLRRLMLQGAGVWTKPAPLMQQQLLLLLPLTSAAVRTALCGPQCAMAFAQQSSCLACPQH
jgi:hypothetical protein